MAKKKEKNGAIHITEAKEGVRLQINNLYSRDHAFYLIAQALTILSKSELVQEEPQSNAEVKVETDGNVQ